MKFSQNFHNIRFSYIHSSLVQLPVTEKKKKKSLFYYSGLFILIENISGKIFLIL